MQSEAPTVSTLYEASPIFTVVSDTTEPSEPSPNHSDRSNHSNHSNLSNHSENEPKHLQSLHTFGSFVMSYNYKHDRNELNTILQEMYGDDWRILKRDQLIDTLFRVMEHIEQRSSSLSGDLKKNLVFDVLFYLSEKSGMNPVEFDTLLLSSMIDLLSMIGKKGTILNKKTKCDECLICLKNLF